MTYKLLALDIDGTIHDRQTDTPLTERTKRAVARVMETGAGVTLATGRMYNSSLPFSQALGITLPIICYQGAFTSNPVTHEIVRETPIPLPLAHRLIRLLEDRGLNPYVFVRDHFYVREMTDTVRQYEDVLKIEADPVSDLVRNVQSPPTKIVVTGDAGPISDVPAVVDAHFNGALAAMHTYDHLCEIGHPDGSKSAALSHLASVSRCEKGGSRRRRGQPQRHRYDRVGWPRCGYGQRLREGQVLRGPRNQARLRARPSPPPRNPPGRRPLRSFTLSLDGPEVRLWRTPDAASAPFAYAEA